MKYYPLFLDLTGKKAVVVGGGSVAERKVSTLIKAGAAVKVISPEITARLKRYKTAKEISHKDRKYRKGDLNGAFLVFICTSSREANLKIADDARELEGAHLINVVDKPSEGNFIVPSSLTRGPLTIAISTEGSSPAVAKAIREELEEIYDADFAKYLRHLKVLRDEALKKIKDDKKRERILKAFSSKKILDILRKRGFKAASREMLSLLDQLI
jgi:precorrin-2 dehydrogenase/sirohydrochlorin ferrochelatase